jgi:hypothetical protein
VNQLLAEIIDAHGGINRWNRYDKVEATIVSGGGFFPLKGSPQDLSPRRRSALEHLGVVIGSVPADIGGCVFVWRLSISTARVRSGIIQRTLTGRAVQPTLLVPRRQSTSSEGIMNHETAVSRAKQIADEVLSLAAGPHDRPAGSRPKQSMRLRAQSCSG